MNDLDCVQRNEQRGGQAELSGPISSPFLVHLVSLFEHRRYKLEMDIEQ